MAVWPSVWKFQSWNSTLTCHLICLQLLTDPPFSQVGMTVFAILVANLSNSK